MCPLPRLMIPSLQEGESEQRPLAFKQPEQKSRDQGDNGEELQLCLPFSQAQMLDPQLTFLKAKTPLDLPAPTVNLHQTQSIFYPLQWLVGEQIPGSGPFLSTGNHQKELP